MTKQDKSVHKKSMGRPPGLKYGSTIPARFEIATMETLDAWATSHGVSRSEAIRRLVEMGLSGASKRISAENVRRRDKATAVLLAPSVDLPGRTQLEKVELPSKIVDVLKRVGIQTVGAVRQASDEKLIRIALLGSKQIRFLRKALGGALG